MKEKKSKRNQDRRKLSFQREKVPVPWEAPSLTGRPTGKTGSLRGECGGRPVEGRTEGDKQGSAGHLAALPSHPRRTPAGVENGWGWNWAFRGLTWAVQRQPRGPAVWRGVGCMSGQSLALPQKPPFNVGAGGSTSPPQQPRSRGSQWARLCPCELWECASASRLPTHGGGAEI